MFSNNYGSMEDSPLMRQLVDRELSTGGASPQYHSSKLKRPSVHTGIPRIGERGTRIPSFKFSPSKWI